MQGDLRLLGGHDFLFSDSFVLEKDASVSGMKVFEDRRDVGGSRHRWERIFLVGQLAGVLVRKGRCQCGPETLETNGGLLMTSANAAKPQLYTCV